MIPFNTFNVDYLASPARGSMAYLAFTLVILDTTLGLESHTFASRHLYFPRLIIHHFYTLQQLSSKLDEILVRGVLVHVVVPILHAAELDYKAVGKRGLSTQSVSVVEKIS